MRGTVLWFVSESIFQDESLHKETSQNYRYAKEILHSWGSRQSLRIQVAIDALLQVEHVISGTIFPGGFLGELFSSLRVGRFTTRSGVFPEKL